MAAADLGDALRPGRFKPAAEAVVVLIITFVAATMAHIPTLWFIIPFVLVTVTQRAYAAYGLTLRGGGTAAFHLVVSTAVFVPYAAGFCLLEHWRAGAGFHPQLPPDFGMLVVTEILVIALPEEFFFRGYLQTQFDRAWGRRYRVFGARVGAGWIAAAALFAICHVPSGGVGRLIVLFPGLWYGWLRARCDTVAVPVAYHAASNILLQILLASCTR